MVRTTVTDAIGRAFKVQRRRISLVDWDMPALRTRIDLPREGARWFHAPGGWYRWSYLDDDWVYSEMPPPSALSTAPVGTVHLQQPDGTWLMLSDKDLAT